MTGQNDRQDESLTGQVYDQAGHCPLTGRWRQDFSAGDGWRVAGGGWRVAGRRVAGSGWRVAGGGWWVRTQKIKK